MIKLKDLLNERIDMTINNPGMWKREKKWNRYNKATDAGKTVFVKLLKDKKTHYVWQVATASSIQVTDLAGKKQFSIKPKDVYEVVELPHTGYKIPKGFNEGKITEAKETIFDVAAKVMKDSQNYNYKSKKGMVKVDMQTANLLTKVWKKVSPQMKKHLAGMGESNPAGLVQTLWAAVK